MRLLLENPSTYLLFEESTIEECDFLARVAEKSGCGLLLDVNNIHVSAFNNGFDAGCYLDGVPWDAVEEIHVAGHTVARFDEERLLIDDHGSPVDALVWQLLQVALERTGPLPVLVEWDTAVPELPVLLAEAEKADRLLDAARENRAARHAA
jgi:uncharacterized protein (UPF0276 family)